MARTRPNPPAIHMLIAMLVVLLPALLAVAWFQRVPEPPVPHIDPTSAVAQARRSAPFAIAAPTNLPDGWQCTKARWTPAGSAGLGGTPSPGNVWTMGYLTPQQMYLGVDQRDAPGDAVLHDVLGDSTVVGSSTVAGRTWERRTGHDDRTRALVWHDGAATTVVSGDLSFDALEAFASSLTIARG